MKVVCINGSPRTSWNTAQMVKSAMKGCEDAGAEVKYYDIFGMNGKGCQSCFACKLLGGKSYGKCAFQDDFTPVLEDIMSADALILGSPVYFSDVTACVRALCERLWFAVLAYSSTDKCLNKHRIPVKIIFTENCPMPGFHKALNELMVNTMNRLIGPAELLEAVNTMQFSDYSKYETSMFDVHDRIKTHEEIFPLDLQKAYELGKKAVAEAQ